MKDTIKAEKDLKIKEGKINNLSSKPRTPDEEKELNDLKSKYDKVKDIKEQAEAKMEALKTELEKEDFLYEEL